MAPRLFVPAEDVPQGSHQVRLAGAPFRYVARVLRLGRGDGLTIFDGTGTEIAASIAHIADDFVDIALGPRTQRPASRCAITLLAAVTKGDKMDLVVQKTTELGVHRIVPVLTERVVVRMDERTAEAKCKRWQTIAQEAARQCERADVPAIDRPIAFSEAVNLPTDKKLLMWERARAVPLPHAIVREDVSVSLLIGPEGGFTEEEAHIAVAGGFSPVSLGSRILRSETAAIVAVALVQAGTGGLE